MGHRFDGITACSSQSKGDCRAASLVFVAFLVLVVPARKPADQHLYE